VAQDGVQGYRLHISEQVLTLGAAERESIQLRGDILFSVWVWIVATGLVVVVFLLIAAAPLLIVTALQGVLFLSELVVRRIAESPKGIVMTLNGLATAIGAALKTFS
jgi:hypothetical protein